MKRTQRRELKHDKSRTSIVRLGFGAATLISLPAAIVSVSLPELRAELLASTVGVLLCSQALQQLWQPDPSRLLLGAHAVSLLLCRLAAAHGTAVLDSMLPAAHAASAILAALAASLTGWIVYRRLLSTIASSCSRAPIVVTGAIAVVGGICCTLARPVLPAAPIGFCAALGDYFAALHLLYFHTCTQIPAAREVPDAQRNDSYDILETIPLKATERKLIRLMEKEKLYTDPELKHQALADHVGLSRHEFSVFLNGHLGQSFYEYLDHYRIPHAQAILESQPEESVIEVALRSGYASKATFNRRFKSATGLTPNEYRSIARRLEGAKSSGVKTGV